MPWLQECAANPGGMAPSADPLQVLRPRHGCQAARSPRLVSSSATPPPRPKHKKKHKTSKKTPASIKSAGKLTPPSLPTGGSNPFADIDRPGGVVAPIRRRRRNLLGSLFQGLLIFLFLGSAVAGVGYLGRKPINDFLKRFEKTNSPPTEVAQVDTHKSGDTTEPPKTDPATTAPAKNTDPPKPEPIKKPEPPKPDPIKKPEPPKPDPIKKPEPPKPEPPKPGPVVETPKPRPAGTVFPRRALIISVNNYIFANPVQFGVGGASIGNLNLALSNGLDIPLSQIYLLSDRNKEDPHPPLKATIEQTITSFLFNSRAQDRIMVFFVGHAVEIEGKAYLAPLEADLQKADSLVELDWVLKRMAACKARQKILVLDGNRFSPTQGLERPSAGPMTEAVDKLLKEPPAGVQVWSSCVMNQQSYETTASPMGLFLDAMRVKLTTQFGDGQQPTDPIPVDKLNEIVMAEMKTELADLKAEQTPRVTGKEADGGAVYDPKEELPMKPIAVLPVDEGGGKANLEMIKLVFNEISTPTVKGSLGGEDSTRYDLLPRFSSDILDTYKADDKKDSELRKQVQMARAALWAVSPTNAGSVPKELAEDVGKIRSDLKVTLAVMLAGVEAPTNDNQFKAFIETREREIAKIMNKLMETSDDLKAAGKQFREGETKRWKANYDFTVARLEAQIAYLYEYQSMLGQLRKDLPPRDPKIHKGWVLAASPTLTGDSNGKKLAASSRKILDKIASENAGTPWELIAKRESSRRWG